MIVRAKDHQLIRLDGARLAELRESANLSLREAAKRVGVSRQTLVNWEREVAVPRHLEGLAGLYGEALTSSGALRIEEIAE